MTTNTTTYSEIASLIEQVEQRQAMHNRNTQNIIRGCGELLLTKEQELTSTEQLIKLRSQALDAREQDVYKREQAVTERERALHVRIQSIEQNERELYAREQEIARRECEVDEKISEKDYEDPVEQFWRRMCGYSYGDNSTNYVYDDNTPEPIGICDPESNCVYNDNDIEPIGVLVGGNLED